MTEEKEHKEAERLQVHTLETAERAAAQENAKLLRDLHAELAQAALSFQMWHLWCDSFRSCVWKSGAKGSILPNNLQKFYSLIISVFHHQMTEEKEHKEAERLQVHTLETAERAAAQENAKLLQDLHAELAQAALSFQMWHLWCDSFRSCVWKSGAKGSILPNNLQKFHVLVSSQFHQTHWS